MKKTNFYVLAVLIITAGFIVSENSYSQWTVCGNLPGVFGRQTVSVVDENNVWVTGGDPINVTYRTTNGGLNWTGINTANLNPFFCLWAKDANTVFAGDNAADGTSRFYKTTNGGISWILIDSVPNSSGFRSIKFSNSIPSFGIALGGWELPNYFLFKTRDGGNTWTKYVFPVYTGYSSAISGLSVIDSLFYAFGTTGGSPSVILTDNGGGNYSLQNLGLDSLGGNFTRGVAFKEDKLTGISGATSFPFISRTTNGGLNWQRINVGNFSASTTSPVMRWIEGTNTCYITSPHSSGILKSINGGLNWAQMTTEGLGTFNMDTKKIGSTVYGYAVCLTSTSSCYILKTADPVAGANKRFFANCSALNPKLFTKGNLSSDGIHTTFGPGTPIRYAAMEFDNTGKLYCIGTELNPSLNILDTASGVLTNLGLITGLTSPDQDNPRLAYNTTDKKMYMSVWANGSVTSYLYTLNLNTREASFIGSGDYNTADIAINSAGECYGLANINQLISVNLSTGEHFYIGHLNYNSGNVIQGLCFDRETNELYVTSWNNDLSRAELRTMNLITAETFLKAVFSPQLGSISGFAVPFSTAVGIQNISSQVPDGYSLKQNYPNPFNPVTKLEFGISDLGYISLKVYDVLGKEVVTLVNSVLAPGIYKYDFDGSNLSSGVYFYKLEADGFVDTKKMYLVK